VSSPASQPVQPPEQSSGQQPEQRSAQPSPVGQDSGVISHRRTHPITPLVSGWKIVVGVVAVLTAQNIASLLEDFTIRRALIGAGVLIVAVIIAILLSGLAWWKTTYAVSEEGVALHSGLISRSRTFAPRAKIESVSVERPLLARLLGLAKVRVEIVGGGESYLDIEYIKSQDAEQLRRIILEVTGAGRPGQAAAAAPETAAGEATADSEAAAAGTAHLGTAAPGTAATPSVTSAPSGSAAPSGSVEDLPATAGTAPSAGGTLRETLYDGVTDGELIAEIPTGRLVHSLLRDMDFLIGIVMSVVGVGLAIFFALWTEGFSLAVIVPLLPALIALPRYVLGRIEAGWGFVSRITPRGLRMRRGLLNTRTDNVASGRIQRFRLRRPLLWRTPGWTAATVTLAGTDDEGENGAENALPVGTHEELGLTLGHLAAPLGTDDDLATIEHLLTARARDIEGIRTPIRWQWIARRTRVTVLLPGAIIQRRGILARTLEIIPRERIQEIHVSDDPFSRRLGVLDLEVRVAAHTAHLTDLPRADARALHGILTRDAARLRRFRDRPHWPKPALAAEAA